MQQDLSAGGYEMLRAAVNTAREHQCQSVSGLRQRMVATWPGRDAEIEEAITYWAAYVQRQHPNGITRC